METVVALVAFQVRVVLPFGAMIAGLAVSATVVGELLAEFVDAAPLPHPAAISNIPKATISAISFRMSAHQVKANYLLRLRF
jgi:hypothetical protein